MQILQRYVIREILQTLAGLCGVLVLIYMSARFVRYLSKAADGVMSADFIATLLALKLVTFMSLMLPVGLFLAILLTLGKLSAQNELTAMSACGAGSASVVRAIAVLAVSFSLILLVLTMVVDPWAETRVQQLEAQARQQTMLGSLLAGQFIETGGGERVLYSEAVDQRNGDLQGLFVRHLGRHGEEIVTARRGRYDIGDPGQGRYLILEDGRRYTGVAGRPALTMTTFAQYGVLLDAGPAQYSRSLSSMTALELWRAGDAPHIAHLQWRLAMPLANLLLAVLAWLMARRPGRQVWSVRVLTAILVYFSYTNLLGVARSLVERGHVSPWLGLWWVHGLMLALVLAVYFWPRWRQQWQQKKTRAAVAGLPT